MPVRTRTRSVAFAPSCGACSYAAGLRVRRVPPYGVRRESRQQRAAKRRCAHGAACGSDAGTYFATAAGSTAGTSGSPPSTAVSAMWPAPDSSTQPRTTHVRTKYSRKQQLTAPREERAAKHEMEKPRGCEVTPVHGHHDVIAAVRHTYQPGEASNFVSPQFKPLWITQALEAAPRLGTLRRDQLADLRFRAARPLRTCERAVMMDHAMCEFSNQVLMIG